MDSEHVCSLPRCEALLAIQLLTSLCIFKLSIENRLNIVFSGVHVNDFAISGFSLLSQVSSVGAWAQGLSESVGLSCVSPFE